MNLLTIVVILFAHWFGDFILQSDWMAQNKSKNNKALALHLLCYSLPLFLFGWKFALINVVLHGMTDFVTSRITSKLYAEKKIHWFFVVIGFDQFIHTSCLLLTYGLLHV